MPRLPSKKQLKKRSRLKTNKQQKKQSYLQKKKERKKWQLLPDKEQWKKWSLPSKYTAIGLSITIVGLLLAILGVFNPQQPQERYKKAQDYLQIAKNYEAEGKYKIMVLNAKRAYNAYQDDEDIILYLAMAHKKLSIAQGVPAAAELLTENKHKLTSKGLWYLGLFKFHNHEIKEAYAAFEKLEFSDLPREIRVDALVAYLGSAHSLRSEDSGARFMQVVQEMRPYVLKELKYDSDNTTEPIVNGQIRLLSFTVSDFLPVVNFRMGLYLLLLAVEKNNHDRASIAINYANDGISAELAQIPHNFFSYFSLLENVMEWDGFKSKNKKLLEDSITYYRKILADAQADSVIVSRFGMRQESLTEERVKPSTIETNIPSITTSVKAEVYKPEFTAESKKIFSEIVKLLEGWQQDLANTIDASKK